MKKYNKYLVIVLLFFQVGFSQQHYTETEKLIGLCKIWGFLKYYHPNVAQGDYNWDQEFIEILPKVEGAESKEDLSEIYLKWINSLGKVKNCRTCEVENPDAYFNKNFDLSWIQDTNMFSSELIESLKFIENNRNQKKSAYTSIGENDNIVITNEPVYKNIDFPNQNLTLLALFKYWNVIEYFFPYKYMADEDWDDVLLEMIPVFSNIENIEEYRLAMASLVAKLDDTHAYVNLNETTGRKWPPVLFRYVENKPVLFSFRNDSLAKLNDLRLGDVLLEINEVKVSDTIEKKLKFISGSNKNIKLFDAYTLVLGGETDSVDIVIERNGEKMRKTIARYDYNLLRKNKTESKKWKILDGNIGYVDMRSIEKEDISNMMDSLLGCQSIIFDIRGYPKYIYKDLSLYLNSERKIFAKGIKPDIFYPGRYRWYDIMTKGKKNNKEKFEGKIVLLVDEQTISRAEFTVMSLQSTNDNVITIGDQTAGTDGYVSEFEFIGGYKTTMSGTGYFYPDGTETQRKGIRIDGKIVQTIEGLISNEDEILQKAIEILTEKK